MKLVIIAAFSLVVIGLTSCRDTNKPASPDKGTVVIGKVDSLFSKSLNEERKLSIYLPAGAEHPDGNKKYPVVFLLDGDAHFMSVAGLVHQLSAVNGNTLIPEMIVVAIPNTDRTRDLTPSNDPNREWAKTAGGAEKFTAFIQELIPYIENNYPAAAHRTLVGHSFGGLFVINTLIHHRELFNNYLAIDPSLWWHNRKLFHESMNSLDTSRFDGKSLFVAEAHTARRGMTHEQLMRDTTEATQHMRSIEEFISYAKSKSANGLRFSGKYYPQDGHSSVVMIAEHDGLRELFNWFGDDPFADYYDPGPTDRPEAMISAVKKHYATVAGNLGYSYPAPEAQIRDIAYYFLRSDRPDMAIALFNYTLEAHPSSSRTMEGIGDYYLDVKDTTKAIENFKASLAIEENKDLREKLNKLLSK